VCRCVRVPYSGSGVRRNTAPSFEASTANTPPTAKMPWCIERPSVGMTFANRKLMTRYMEAHGAVHGGLFRQFSDSGSSLQVRCKLCSGGALSVVIRRKRDGKGGRVRNPPAEITKVDSGKPCTCRPAFPGIDEGAAALLGSCFSKRETFTAVGNQLFSRGAMYARKDTGRFIAYTCRGCRVGSFLGELHKRTSIKTGKMTWAPPVRVVVAAACSSICGANEGYPIPADEPTTCLCCLSVAEDPVSLVCCQMKQQACCGCLQGWIDQRPRQLQMNTLASSWETDHSQPHVIAFDPVFPVSGNQFYTCPGCSAQWTNQTEFVIRRETKTLKQAFEVPIGFFRDDKRSVGQEQQLRDELSEYASRRDGVSPREDTAMMRIFADSVRAENTTQDRLAFLHANGYTYDEAVSYLITNGIAGGGRSNHDPDGNEDYQDYVDDEL